MHTPLTITIDAWPTAEVERLPRRAAGEAAGHWTMVFAVLITLTLAGPVFTVWPTEPWIERVPPLSQPQCSR